MATDMATHYGSWGSIHSNKGNYRVYITYNITETADSYTVNLTEIGVQAYSKTYDVIYFVGTWSVLVNGVSVWSQNRSGTEIPTSRSGAIRGDYIANLTGLSKTFSKTHSSQSVTVKIQGSNITIEPVDRISGTTATITGRSPNTTAYETIQAKTTYTITFDTKGGSGSFGQLTKWHGEPLTIHSGKPTKANYTFVNWKNRSTGGTVDPGKQIAAGSNGNYVLDAQWKIITYPVTFDANGGTGGPVNTTKNSGSALTFSSAKPTKKDASSGKAYDFLGWAETSAPNTIVYPVGNTTIAANVNRAVNLIAVWQEHYYPPTITNTKIFRCNEDGQASDEGKYAYVSFDWAVDNWKYPTNTASEVKVTVGDITKTIPEAVDRLSGSVAVKLGSPVGKNLLPYPYASSNANKTVNGITYTVTDDGILTVTGTPTAGTGFAFSKNLIDASRLKAGDEIYISTGTNYDTKAYLRLLYADPTPMEGITRIDVDVKKVVITDAMVTRGVWFELWIPQGTDSISITVKPMVSFSSDGIYEPYKEQLFDVDIEYPVAISVADKQASTETLYKTTVTGRLNVAEYPLDFGSAVNSIGVFKPASDEAEYEKVMDIGGDVKIAGDLFVRGFKLIDLFYPIGSYYETSDSSFDPNTTWGGTWSKLTKHNIITKNATNVTLKTYASTIVTSVTLPANSKWLLLGLTVSGQGTAGVTSNCQFIRASGTGDFYPFSINSVSASSGAYLIAQAYVNATTQSVINLTRYNYTSADITNAFGNIVAIPLDNYNDGKTTWHRTA